MIKELKNIIPAGISEFTGIVEDMLSKTLMVVKREREGSLKIRKKIKKIFAACGSGLLVTLLISCYRKGIIAPYSIIRGKIVANIWWVYFNQKKQ